MCIQFRSYLRGARFTLRTDHKSLVWLHRFKDTEGMMSRWLHSLQQFQFSIIHRPGKDHGNADGLSRAPSSPCRQCTRPDCPPATLIHSRHRSTVRLCRQRAARRMQIWYRSSLGRTGSLDWMMISPDRSRTSGDSFHISALQKEGSGVHDTTCIGLLADEFPAWAEVKSMLARITLALASPQQFVCGR